MALNNKKPGDPILAAEWNLLAGRNPIPKGPEGLPIDIFPCAAEVLGDSDVSAVGNFDDERYWVRPMWCETISTSDPQDSLSLVTFASDAISTGYKDDSDKPIIPATNLAELADQTHFITAGTVVMVHALYRIAAGVLMPAFVFSYKAEGTSYVIVTNAGSGSFPRTNYKCKLVNFDDGTATGEEFDLYNYAEDKYGQGDDVTGSASALAVNDKIVAIWEPWQTTPRFACHVPILNQGDAC